MVSENEALVPASGHVDVATRPVARANTVRDWQWRNFRQNAIASLLNIP